MVGGAGGKDSPVTEEAALNDLHDEIRGLSLSHVGAEPVPGREAVSGLLLPESTLQAALPTGCALAQGLT